MQSTAKDKQLNRGQEELNIAKYDTLSGALETLTTFSSFCYTGTAHELFTELNIK